MLLRLYLLAGLVAHKVVWEALKRRGAGGSAAGASGDRRAPSALARALTFVKTGILLGLVVQVVSPEVWPIVAHARLLRVVGVATYTLGLAVAILGRAQLGSSWSDIEAPQVRHNHGVVSHGVYRYIRHPIYVGDLLLILGFELALNSWCVLGVLLLAPFVLQRALREERMLSSALPAYKEYCARTKRFVPFVV